jgi:streptomycin 6-kinase
MRSVLPVRTSEGTRAVLKIGPPSDLAHLVLRRWAGDGAARLLRADPPRGAVLVERLRAESLETVPDGDACEIVASLYRRLHVPAMPQLRALTSQVEQWSTDFETLPRSAPIPHRLVEQAHALARDFADGPNDAVLHGDLHYGTVLAADREPWLAIAPKPSNGDPHYELAPMLWNRWDELAGDIRRGVQRRFYRLIDAAGLDEDRAKRWVLVRVVRQAMGDPANVTKYVALAKAVQD